MIPFWFPLIENMIQLKLCVHHFIFDYVFNGKGVLEFSFYKLVLFDFLSWFCFTFCFLPRDWCWNQIDPVDDNPYSPASPSRLWCNEGLPRWGATWSCPDRLVVISRPAQNSPAQHPGTSSGLQWIKIKTIQINNHIWNYEICKGIN